MLISKNRNHHVIFFIVILKGHFEHAKPGWLSQEIGHDFFSRFISQVCTWPRELSILKKLKFNNGNFCRGILEMR